MLEVEDDIGDLVDEMKTMEGFKILNTEGTDGVRREN
jgi:hypothetical protein